MTPERHKWWNSLPKEEKQVRLAIKKFETDIKWRKKHFTGGLFYTSDQQKSYIAMGKHAIKALRKQIAQRPVMRTQPPTASPYKCPCCGASLMYLLRCAECGQKLRWE